MKRPTRIYFFATCLVDLLFPAAGLSAMQLLRRAGIEVVLPRDQTCCGQPAFNAGFRNAALGVARAQLAAFSEPLPVVVPSGSCAGMLRKHWPTLFAGQADETAARALASRTWELTEFLVDVLDIRLADLGPATRVAVHCSCSARRELGVADRIEQLLRQLDGIEVLEPARATECCGFGGTFAIKLADVSGAMVQDKTAALRATGADCVVSQDCGCLMNIGGAFERQGSSPQVQHIAEFLWQRTTLAEDR